MKWSILVGTLALGLAVGSPSFGAGLLDRILTTKGCGCETKPVQKCGAEKGKPKAKCGTAKPKQVAKPKAKGKGGNLLQDLVGHLNLNVGHTGKSKAKCGAAKPKRVAKSKSKRGSSGNSNTVPTAEARVSPLPPAPIVDPSAFLDRRSRTVTASYVR